MTTPAALDLARIRSEFPALAGDTVFLDNAGGSQVLRRVADRVSDYLLTSSVQLGASYATSEAAGERVIAARHAMAELVNAAHPDEVAIGGSTTALMYLFTDALRHGVRPGDEIIVTETDHEANIGGWMRLASAGAVVKIWPVNPETLQLDLDALDRLLGPRTTWVAMTWASNVLGTVTPSPKWRGGCTQPGDGSASTRWPTRRTGCSTCRRAARTWSCSASTRCSARTRRSCGGATS